MATIPTQQHMTLVLGSSNAVFTGNKIKIGNLIKVQGSDSNNGVYTVVDIQDSLSTASALGTGVVKSCTFSSGVNVITAPNDDNLSVGMSATGTGMNAGTFITAINTSTNVLTLNNVTTQAHSGSGLNITFKDGDIYYILKGRNIETENDSDKAVKMLVQGAVGDKLIAHSAAYTADGTPPALRVWSENRSSDPSNAGDGWLEGEINVVLNGSSAKHIFYFVGEALRTCNIENENSSLIKWYGYIQGQQFSKDEGLIFSEWQEHLNSLDSPASASGLSIGYITNSHTATVAANYFITSGNISRGVKHFVSDSVSKLQLDGAINNAATSIGLENTSGTDVVDQLIPGNIISINNALEATALPEIIFIKKPAQDSGAITVSRGYGNTTKVAYSDNATNVLVRGAAFNIGITEDTEDGLWVSNTWELYQTFIYDETQESLPVQFSDGVATSSMAAKYFPTSGKTGGNKKLKISIYADVAYSGRITGGRMYIREKNSNNPLTLFVDIDLIKGARVSMLDDHTPWSYNSTNTTGFYVPNLIASSPNIDTYTSLNGFSPDENSISIGKLNEKYKCSTVSNRRAFIGNIVIEAKNKELRTYGDRIMYSEINKFDTFLNSNYIDISSGDFGEYVAMESFADRLIAYKHNLVHIINISNPNPTGWYLEQTINNAGVSYHFSVTKTEFGIAWVNESGCYLYDGSRVSNLIERKIGLYQSNSGDLTPWAQWSSGSANFKDLIIGYDKISNVLIIRRTADVNSTEANTSYIYDFDTKGWVYNTNLFSDEYTPASGTTTFDYPMSNFATDYNNNLIFIVNAETKKYLAIPESQSEQSFITKDIVFGEEGVNKKLYKIIVSYKSTATITTPFSYSIGGNEIFTNFSGNMASSFVNIDPPIRLNGTEMASSTTATTFTIDSTNIYKVGDIIKIDSEQMLITKVVSATSLTVIRSYNNTAAANHANDKLVSLLTQDIAVFTTSAIGQSFQIKFNTGSTASYIEINDITLEYRTIRGSTVS